jgi:hypothetical protein
MYGKEWEAIPLRHFTNGVWSRNAGDTCPRLVMKNNTVINALRHLKGKGLIEVREHAIRAFQYRIREPKEIEAENFIVYIREHQPKQLRAIHLELRRNRNRLPPAYFEALKAMDERESFGPSPASNPVAGRAQRRVARGIRLIINKPNTRLQKEQIKKLAPSKGASGGNFSQSKVTVRKVNAPTVSEHAEAADLAPDSEKFDAAFSRVEQQRRARRERRISASNPQVWIDRWSEAMAAFYPDVPAGVQERTVRDLKLALRDWDIPLTEVPDFIAWVVQKWSSLRRNVFSYRTNRLYGPPTPDLKFALRHLQTVYAAYKNDVFNRLEVELRIAKHKAAPPPPLQIDHAKAIAVQQKLGLKRWD